MVRGREAHSVILGSNSKFGITLVHGKPSSAVFITLTYEFSLSIVTWYNKVSEDLLRNSVSGRRILLKLSSSLHRSLLKIEAIKSEEFGWNHNGHGGLDRAEADFTGMAAARERAEY